MYDRMLCVVCGAPGTVGRAPRVGLPQFRAARGTPCCSSCWCSWSSRSAHAIVSAIVPPGPARALMKLPPEAHRLPSFGHRASFAKVGGFSKG